ncbi:MAG: MFS transporter [Aestuariivita sp.]|nr:MFS transporter [Aestuariivita sp.]
MTLTLQGTTERLPAYAIFAGLLAAAGLPIYIHAPKFYVDEYGVGLATLGAVLFGLRLLDVVQDPILGWVSARLLAYRSILVGIGLAFMSLGMLGLFAITPPIDPLLWFALMLTVVFSSFSLLSINFYAQGVAKASYLVGDGHLHLARWRETGALLGVCLAAIVPELLSRVVSVPFLGFSLAFSLVALLAFLLMRREWINFRVKSESGFGSVMTDQLARRLLIVALLNAAPVAVTSTLFLFFVESRLQIPEFTGFLLLVFFLSAAIAAPVWGYLAEIYRPKFVLLVAMVVSIGAFGFVLALQAGDILFFALICIISGAALGADLTILPAMFAMRMSQISPTATEGFGLWSFVSKFTLAFAAVLLLPTLEYSGFQSGMINSEFSLWLLSILYSGVPCVLKLLAIVILYSTKIEE